VWKTTFDCHYFAISLEYHKVVNLAASGSDNSTSGKVSPLGIFQETKGTRINNQLK
jgi:hypothetical protein